MNNIETIRDSAVELFLQAAQTNLNETLFKGYARGATMCSTLVTPEEYRCILLERLTWEGEIALSPGSSLVTTNNFEANAFWEHRSATVLIERVFEVLKVAWDIHPQKSGAVTVFALLTSGGEAE